MTRLFMLAAAFALAGCGPSYETEALRGQARQAAFVQCMELAAKITRQADDDVADIVKSCGSQSYYNTNYIRAKP